MIVLDAVDLDRRQANLRELGPSYTWGEKDFDRITRLVRRLGVHDLDLRHDDGAAALAAGAAKHRWIAYEDSIDYEVSFPHRKESGALVALYSALALATYGTVDESILLQLRLAIYELCLNALEHGRLKETPGEIRLGLSLAQHAIRGWVEDCCEPFNPLQRARESWGQRVAMRARRGYGIMIVIRLMDELEYEYTGRGNRISFCKRL
jgi:anti-sigma regulatory factor (Ser/Thr protein kinase)